MGFRDKLAPWLSERDLALSVFRCDDFGVLDELAAAMRRLHERSDLRAELARRGREFAVRRLGKEAALEQLERELLG